MEDVQKNIHGAEPLTKDVEESFEELAVKEEVVPIVEPQEELKGRTLKKGEYIEGLGRRKRATARVRIFNATPAASVGSKGFEINGKEAKVYFQAWQYEVVTEPLAKAGMLDKISMSVRVDGGGITGQAEATRMGLSRALVELEPSLRNKLKRGGYLTRDPREKERKKYGLKKARRAPQFSKR